MYVKINTDGSISKYPYTVKDLKTDFPNISFSSNISENIDYLNNIGIYQVHPVQQPIYKEYESKLVEQPPILINNIWLQQWSIVPLSEDEARTAIDILAQQIRARRDQLLQKSDWTQYKDIPEQISALWGPYRQALRDITAQKEFPYNIIWPEKPE